MLAFDTIVLFRYIFLIINQIKDQFIYLINNLLRISLLVSKNITKLKNDNNKMTLYISIIFLKLLSH